MWWWRAASWPTVARWRRRSRRWGGALPVAAHAGQQESLDALIERSLDHFGRVDILVNNAGINPTGGALSELGPELFQKMFEVNTKGPWYLASRLAPGSYHSDLFGSAAQLPGFLDGAIDASL